MILSTLVGVVALCAAGSSVLVAEVVRRRRAGLSLVIARPSRRKH